MVSEKWNPKMGTSTLHKAIRHGDVEMAAYAAAYLCSLGYGGIMSAWRRVLAVPGEDLNGSGVEKVVAFYQAWNVGKELDNLFAAILHLCTLVQERGGKLDRSADELKNAATHWIQSGREVEPPDYAYDWHSGHGTLQGWWDQVNAMGPASKWREDAMKVKVVPRHGSSHSEEPKQEPLI